MWTLKHCEYSKFVETALLFCGCSKVLGSKIEGIQILWLSNMKSNKRIKLGF